MPDPKPEEFEQFTCGPLAARVYNDGRVIIGAQQGVISTKIEVEVSVDIRTAREFCAKLSDLIKKQDWLV